MLKKFAATLLSLALFFSVAFADGIDISGLSFDELVKLKDQINLAIWESKEWQEVTVPQGIWEVGVDIPAGHWVIKAAGRYSRITIGETLDETKKDISYRSDFYFSEAVYSPDYTFYSDGDLLEFDIELKKGLYVCVENGSCVFSPYAGKPSLGFEW